MSQGGNLIFNFKRIYDKQLATEGFEDSLRYFNVANYETTDKNLVCKYGNLRQILIYVLYGIDKKLLHYKFFQREQWYSSFRKVGLLFSSHSNNNLSQYKDILEGAEPHSSNYICQGKFENPAFFDQIRPVLQKEFTPKELPKSENRELYEIIDSTNSVCVSIRRGDFLSDKFRKDFYVCDENYFHKAILEVKKRIENPVLIFFSDDIEWVKSNIKTDLPSYYETGNDPVWEKLRLMYSCKHFVISNSTFSWWAQYLSRSDRKVVICPNRWSNNNVSNSTCRLLEESFISISCG